ncbi:hypothetical protein HYV81_00915 [Candidatus Woesearchaeota archaeon]|nr:hypothetical protein [Candidatus Woesearchaeota archaeon]
MIYEFQYYLDKNLARKASPDPNEAQSLMNKAEGRLRYSIEVRKVTEQASTYIFEDIYECLREAGQSLMSLKGYKPYSHEALISFLIEMHAFKEADLNALDRYRNLRNKAVYRGEHISSETCKEALEFLRYFLPVLKKEYYKIVKR